MCVAAAAMVAALWATYVGCHSLSKVLKGAEQKYVITSIFAACSLIST